MTKYSSRRTLGHARRLPGGCVSETGDETNEELLRRGRRAVAAFDQELIETGIAKQGMKDSPIAWSNTWLVH